MIGDFDTALEWSKIAAMSASGRRRALTSLLEARIRLQLGQREKASQILESSLEQAHKVGSERDLASCYLVQGLLERNADDYSTALYSFKRALDIYKRLDSQDGVNDCLLKLAETEVMLSSYLEPTVEGNQTESWLAQLEYRALEKDLPGYLGLSLLLKAKLLLNQNEIQEAHLLIEEVRKLTHQSSMNFLKDKIVEVEALAARHRLES
jgi:tetratricopeptide (TPR) repeat protein